MKVKKVERLEKREPVYDLEVPKYHNFSVNNGIIVHNCIDAVRYAQDVNISRRRVGAMSKTKLGVY